MLSSKDFAQHSILSTLSLSFSIIIIIPPIKSIHPSS